MIVEFRTRGGVHVVDHTSSRISISFSASALLSGGQPLGDCSARNVVEMMKGISCASTPSFARSSGAIGGKSGEGLSSSVGYARDDGVWDSLWGTYGARDILSGAGVGSWRGVIGITGC